MVRCASLFSFTTAPGGGGGGMLGGRVVGVVRMEMLSCLDQACKSVGSPCLSTAANFELLRPSFDYFPNLVL